MSLPSLSASGAKASASSTPTPLVPSKSKALQVTIQEPLIIVATPSPIVKRHRDQAEGGSLRPNWRPKRLLKATPYPTKNALNGSMSKKSGVKKFFRRLSSGKHLPTVKTSSSFSGDNVQTDDQHDFDTSDLYSVTASNLSTEDEVDDGNDANSTFGCTTETSIAYRTANSHLDISRNLQVDDTYTNSDLQSELFAKIQELESEAEAHRLEKESWHKLKGEMESSMAQDKEMITSVQAELSSVMAEKTELLNKCETLLGRGREMERGLIESRHQQEALKAEVASLLFANEQLKKLQTEDMLKIEELSKENQRLRDESSKTVIELGLLKEDQDICHHLISSLESENAELKEQMAANNQIKTRDRRKRTSSLSVLPSMKEQSTTTHRPALQNLNHRAANRTSSIVQKKLATVPKPFSFVLREERKRAERAAAATASASVGASATNNY